MNVGLYTGSQDKEHMMKRLYEYVCDKTSATIKGEKVVSLLKVLCDVFHKLTSYV